MQVKDLSSADMASERSLEKLTNITLSLAAQLAAVNTSLERFV